MERKNVLKNLKGYDAWDHTNYKLVKAEADVIIENLEKQEPMQVVLISEGEWDGNPVYEWAECPKCGANFEEDDRNWESPFCCECGQALHWFEEESE